MEQQVQQPQIDLNSTQGLKTEDGSSVFQQGIILRKISKFITGTSEDALMPIPVFYDPKTGKIVVDSVPKELRDELADELI
jgi:nucleoid-associated protein YejK